MDNLEQEPMQTEVLPKVDTDLLAQTTEEDQQVIEESVAESEGSDESEDFYLIGEEEVPLSEIKEWREGHLRQSDYTKKTQEVSEKRKALEAKEEKVQSKVNELDSLIAGLESELIGAESDEDLDELMELDPSAYLKREKELQAKRAKINELKAKASEHNQSISQEQLKVEQDKLLKANPDWIDATGNVTEKYQSDMKMIDGYLNNQGFTAQDKAGIVSAKHWAIIQDAARYQASKGKAKEVTQQAKKAQRVNKPVRGQSGIDAEIAQARAQLKKTGTDRDYMALEKLLKLKGKK